LLCCLIKPDDFQLKAAVTGKTQDRVLRLTDRCGMTGKPRLGKWVSIAIDLNTSIFINDGLILFV